MESENFKAFIQEWVDSWNARDLERILSHFANDVTFTSPAAVLVDESTHGVIHGKAALRDYWAEALRRKPDLHFELLGGYLGVNTLVINYRNQRGALVCEVLELEGGLVIRGHATYLDGFI